MEFQPNVEYLEHFLRKKGFPNLEYKKNWWNQNTIPYAFLNHEIKFKYYLPLTKQRALGSVSGDQLGDGKHAGWTFSLKFRGESNFKITQSLFWLFPSLYARSWFQIFCTTVLAWMERSSFFLHFSICNWWVTQSDSVFINKRFIFEISIPLQENLPYFPPLAEPIDIIKHT